MIIPKFQAHVKNGILKIVNLDNFNSFLKGFKEGQEVTIKVEKQKKNRTLDQNAWYWAGVLPTVAEYTGNSTEELHEIFKRMFLSPQFITYRDKQIKVPGSTTTLSTVEFSEYIEKVIAEAAGMGIIVPEAGQFYS